MAETLNNFVFHHLQNDFFHGKKYESNSSCFNMLSSAFNSAFVANVQSFE